MLINKKSVELNFQSNGSSQTRQPKKLSPRYNVGINLSFIGCHVNNVVIIRLPNKS